MRRKEPVVRIEEKCGCGGELILLVDQEIGRLRVEERRASVREAWKQIDRWRKLHAGCRSLCGGLATRPTIPDPVPLPPRTTPWP